MKPHPLDALFGRDLVRRALKQKITEPRPTCHYCGRRIAATALARWNGKLMKPSTRRSYLYGFRRFVEHRNEGKRCPGSDQTMCMARGFDR